VENLIIVLDAINPYKEREAWEVMGIKGDIMRADSFEDLKKAKFDTWIARKGKDFLELKVEPSQVAIASSEQWVYTINVESDEKEKYVSLNYYFGFLVPVIKQKYLVNVKMSKGEKLLKKIEECLE